MNLMEHMELPAYRDGLLLLHTQKLAARRSRVIGLVLAFEDASDNSIASGFQFYEGTHDPELLDAFRALGRSLKAQSNARLRVAAFL